MRRRSGTTSWHVPARGTRSDKRERIVVSGGWRRLRHREAAIVIPGSRAVLQALQALTKLVSKFQADVWRLRTERERPTGTDAIDTWQKVEATRTEIIDGIEKLLAMMNDELVLKREDERA